MVNAEWLVWSSDEDLKRGLASTMTVVVQFQANHQFKQGRKWLKDAEIIRTEIERRQNIKNGESK